MGSSGRWRRGCDGVNGSAERRDAWIQVLLVLPESLGRWSGDPSNGSQCPTVVAAYPEPPKYWAHIKASHVRPYTLKHTYLS